MATSFSKPAPYLIQQDSYPIQEGALWLRNTFKPLMHRRLNTVYYGGFKHNFIPEFISKHKITHPHFLKVDFSKFYPSIAHDKLAVEVLVAYKKLLGLSYVPVGFSKKFNALYWSFIHSLPISNKGLPLNSAMSKALASLIYCPFLLELKKNVNIKCIAFVDDLLFLTQSKKDSTLVYHALHNFCARVSLTINLAKVQQGTFAGSQLDYCGWRFAGGYCSINPEKSTAFKEKLQQKCKSNHRNNPRAFIKNINSAINGFGHHYKFGHVSGLYEKLDASIRANVKIWYKDNGRKIPTNSALETLGLQSLVRIKKGIKIPIISTKKYQEELQQKIKTEKHKTELVFHYLESLYNQNKTIIAFLGSIDKQLKAII